MENKSWEYEADKICRQIRKDVLRISNKGGDGNLQSIFSAIDLLWVLYSEIMNFDVKNFNQQECDSFFVSKGQITLGLYLILEKKGFFEMSEIESFCGFQSRFGLQLDRTKFAGEIINSAGSLGHGLPMAVGAAMANKIQNRKSKIFTLVGDGELNEGTMWESFLLAAHYELDNLCIIIDDNNSSGKMINLFDLRKKLEAFEIQVIEIDGHDFQQIISAFQSSSEKRPKAIIAHTIRGYGSNTMMADSKWFHRAPNDQELLQLIKEVESFERGSFSNGIKCG